MEEKQTLVAAEDPEIKRVMLTIMSISWVNVHNHVITFLFKGA